MNSNDPNHGSFELYVLFFVHYINYFIHDDSNYSVLMLFSMKMFTFPTEGIVMIVTNYAYPLFIYHIFSF